jgi:hypothetical protein
LCPRPFIFGNTCTLRFYPTNKAKVLVVFGGTLMKSKMNSTTEEVSSLFKEGHFVLKCLSTRTTWSGEKALD